MILAPDKLRTQLHASDFVGITHTLVLQPTRFCDLDCSYCYLPNRAAKGVMSHEVLQAIASKVLGSSFVTDDLTILFHAGEPLTAGINWFQNALHLLDDAASDRLTLSYQVQTNGLSLNDAWIDLFSRYAVDLSISIDGPKRLNDRHRVRRNKSGTHDEIMNSVARLHHHGYPFCVLCVLTNDSLDSAPEMFEFFSAIQPKVLAFNFEEIEGCNHSSSLSTKTSFERLSAFLDAFWNIAARYNFPYEIREFEYATGNIYHCLRGNNVENSLVTPMAYITVGVNGDLSTFSPELIEVGHDFVLGNVLRNQLPEIVTSKRFQEIALAVADGTNNCRQRCEYFRFCGGGSPSNKFAEHADLSSTETLWCRNAIQLPLDLATKRILHLGRDANVR